MFRRDRPVSLLVLAGLLALSCGDRKEDVDPLSDDSDGATEEGPTRDEFEELFGDIYCENNNVCLEAAGFDPFDCDQAAEDEDEPVECVYNVVAATACLEALETAECDDLGFLPVPDICSEVCPLVGGEDTDDDSATDDTGEDTPLPDDYPMWNTDWWVTDWAEAIECGQDEFFITLITENWGYEAEFYMADTAFGKRYEEEHTFVDFDNGDSPDTWTEFNRGLETDAASYIADARTKFSCEDGDFDPSDALDFQVTFAAVVYTVDGEVADCIVFGHDPDALLGTVPAGLSPPAWVNAATCRDVNP